MTKYTLKQQVILVVVLLAVFTVCMSTLIFQFFEGHLLSVVLLIVVSIILGLLLIQRLFEPLTELHEALDFGLESFNDKDFSINVSNRTYPEFAHLVTTYNRLAEVLRAERMTIYQRELLLDTVIQTTPVAMFLVNMSGRIVYHNIAAKTLLNQKKSVVGQKFAEKIEKIPTGLYHAAINKENGLITDYVGNEAVVYQLNCQQFSLNSQSHWLYLFKNMTAEISRNQNDTSRQVIRMISHELNNSLAPISSLTHSAQKIIQSDSNWDMLPDILSTIARRSQHLKEFVSRYASYAKLAQPVFKPVKLAPFCQQLATLCQVKLSLNITQEVVDFDPVQMEQVIINLVKNAKESGGNESDVNVDVSQENNKLFIRIGDRGQGMSAAQMQKALLPFFTTKANGSGLGLALCNEIISAHGGKIKLENRQGGGLMVTLSFPLEATENQLAANE